MSLLWKTEVLQSLFQNIPVHPYTPYSSFISFSNKREKKILLALLHFLHYCTIDQSAKMQKCKVQAVWCVALWRMGRNSQFKFLFPFVLCWHLLFKGEKNLYWHIEMFGFLPNQLARIKMKVWCILMRFVHSKCQFGEMTHLKNVKVLPSN